MKKRDYELVKNGKYNMTAIMQKAWAYKNDLFCTIYRNNFKAALKAAWVDARLAMDTYKAQSNPVKMDAKQGNVLKSLFLGNHPEYRYYDSSWK